MRSKESDNVLIDRFRLDVLDQSESEQRLRRFEERLQFTSRALEEVTGMAPDKLRDMTDSVLREFSSKGDRFFSIPAQVFWVTGFTASAIIVLSLAAMLF